MALLGPMLVVAESSATDFIDVLGKAGAFPIAQTRWADVPAAIAETQPVALALAEARDRGGAFRIAQPRWADVPAAIAEPQPVPLAIAEPQPKPSPRHVDAA